MSQEPESADFTIFRPLAREGLLNFLPEGSFASLTKSQVARELDAVLGELRVLEGEDEIPSAVRPMFLHSLVLNPWSFDIEWLKDDDGAYRADDGEIIRPDRVMSLSSAQHLAVYGFYLINQAYWDLGPRPLEGDIHNEFGWTDREVTLHQGESVLAAYQCLVYAMRLEQGVIPSKEELERAALSMAAKARAEALHSRPGGSREKRQMIRRIWASGKYSSRDVCAEQECAALDMSFSTARKALRGTPEPT